MQISRLVWNNYVKRLSVISNKAAGLMSEYIEKYGLPETSEQRQLLLDYANSLTVKYGEGAAELACEMYDAIGALEGMILPSAVPAELMNYGDVAKAMNGAMKQSHNTELISSVVGRTVKQASADTMLHNAKRDGAQWAWIPSGDTCAFCITLASRGWQPASKMQLDGGHAEHIHANCDCNFVIRFNSNTNVQGYDPDKYLEMYENADTSSYGMTDGHFQNMSTARINGMRRAAYAKNKAEILAQKSSAREKSIELNSSKVEEIKLGTAISAFEKKHFNDSTESGVLIKANGETVEFGGIENHVIGDESALAAMDGGRFTHNHPNNATYSTTDIGNGIARGNLKELRAITKNGDIHILENNATLEDRRKFTALYSEANRKYERIANEKIRRGEIADKQGYIEQRKEQWLRDNAEKYGLRYTKEKLNVD